MAGIDRHATNGWVTNRTANLRLPGRPGTVLFVICLMVLPDCSRTRAAEQARDGGTVNGVVFQRIGKVVPGRQNESSEHPDKIDARPIVLWRGSTPAAVLYYRTHTPLPGVIWEERIERFDSQPGESWLGRRRGPFPLISNLRPSITLQSFDDTHGFDMQQIVTADIDGDGVEELILPRNNGAIGVYGVDKVLFEQPGLPAPKGMRYQVQHKTTAKLKGHDVAFFVLELEGKHDPSAANDQTQVPRFAILRVDQRGISRFPLPDTPTPIDMLHAIGAINRPGSDALDEILAFFHLEGDESHGYLSRQRSDGRTIAPPKELYVHIDPSSLRFMFLPETSQAILADDHNKHVYFFHPEKPMNWIADLNLNAFSSSPYSIQILYPFDRGAPPKVVFAVADTRNGHPTRHVFYALDAKGRAFRPNATKKVWQPLNKPEPFLHLSAPSLDHRFAGMLAQPGAETVLAVYSRQAMMKQLSEDEIVAAAQEFLQPERIAQMRKIYLDVNMKQYRIFSNLVEAERNKKRIATEVTTVEQWQRLLPESYQQVSSTNRRDFEGSLRVELEAGLTLPIDSQDYRNIDQYKTWLRHLKLGAQTVLHVVRHGMVATDISVDRFLPSQLEFSTVGHPFDFRGGAEGLTAILPLAAEFPPFTKPPLAFFSVVGPWVRN
jgi:hypothetical protein